MREAKLPVGGAAGKFRRLSGLAALACAGLALSLAGCSAKGGKSPAKIVDNPGTVDKNTLSGLDSLVQANKGKGKGVVTGFLSGEGKTLSQALLGKVGVNAAGQRRALTHEEVPLTGATILFFDALRPTTAAETTVTTDTAGHYAALLREGQYFGFAVHLDLETFQLVTASIPDIRPIKDSAVSVDTATAIEDVTSPSVATVYDASAPNDDGVFLVGSIPSANAKINIIFSEPMQRESAKGVVLGRIDTSNSSSTMALADTVKDATLTWSGDSRQLTLGVPALQAGAQYGIILPTSLKDLAKNPLDKEYKATFLAVAAQMAAAAPFAVVSTTPAAGDSLKPIQTPVVTFNRPVDMFSLLAGAKVAPAVKGYWEVRGAQAVFQHKDPFELGKAYTVTLPDSVKDLTGATLGKPFSFGFAVKDFEGAAKDKTGPEQQVALAMEAMFDAYLQGDLGRFGANFHPNFRFTEDGNIQSRDQFLAARQKDAAQAHDLAAGVLAPVYDNSAAACKDFSSRWKVMAKDSSGWLWVDARTSPGQAPRIWDKDLNEIRDGVDWDRTGPRFTYQGKQYGYAIDYSLLRGPVNADAANNDLRFQGDLLRQTSTVALEPVYLKSKDNFLVDGGVIVSGDTAKVAVKMTSVDSTSRWNFGEMDRMCKSGTAGDTSLQILKFLLVYDGSRWLVHDLQSSGHVNQADMQRQVSAQDFSFNRTQPITLLAPVDNAENAADAQGRVTFRFQGLDRDSVGGYLVGLAEDPKFIGSRPLGGALLFVQSQGRGKDQAFILDSAGQPAGGATLILRDVRGLNLPGWERTQFQNPLARLVALDQGIAGVYDWKAIAVKDTSAAQFLANGFSPDRFYGESDFGPHRGFFAVKRFPSQAQYAQLQTAAQPAPGQGTAPVTGFGDRDMDGYPDFIEVKYHTNPNDPGSYPDFRLDTDGDGLADFLEKMLDPDGSKGLVTTAANPDQKAAEIDALRKLGIEWKDSDGDGFPDDIEQLLGFNPQDKNSNPGTRARVEKPTGLFAGKLKLGDKVVDFGFRVLPDSALKITYSVYLGDTLSRTVRAVFKDDIGALIFPVLLPAKGPDSGRSLLVRANYDRVQALLMGPVDKIDFADTTSTNFGGGPNVGWAAASGRGEDVSRYLPAGSTGSAPSAGTGSPAIQFGYRQPPAGVQPGNLFQVSKGADGQYRLAIISDLGDTLGYFERALFHPQPDGSFQLEANAQSSDAARLVNKSMDVHCMVGVSKDSAGREILVADGAFHSQLDSCAQLDPATRACLDRVSRDIPGQFSVKASTGDVKRDASGFVGTLKGWVQQDKLGTGLTGGGYQPVAGCPAGQTCQPAGTVPVTQPSTLLRPFVAGLPAFQKAMQLDKIAAGATFYLSVQGAVLRCVNDSAHVQAAPTPWCGQVVLKPELIPLGDSATPADRDAYNRIGQLLGNPQTLVIVIEDQAMAGVPAKLDRARDGSGAVRTGLYVGEPRPLPALTGTEPKCGEPAPSQVPQPGGYRLFSGDPSAIKNALFESANRVRIAAGPDSLTADVQVDGGSINQDPVSRAYLVREVGGQGRTFVFIAKQTDGNALLVAADLHPVVGVMGGQTQGTTTCPAGQTCPPPGGTVTGGCPQGQVCPPPMYRGGLDTLRLLLSKSGNLVLFQGPAGPMKDSVNPALLSVDAAGQVTGRNGAGRSFFFLGIPGDDHKPLLGDGGLPLVNPMQPAPAPVDTGKVVTGCPAGQTCPPPGGVPTDTGKVAGGCPAGQVCPPPPYRGGLDTLRQLLLKSGNMVLAQGQNGPVKDSVNPASLGTDAQGAVFGRNGAGRAFTFLAIQNDDHKPWVADGGLPVVMPMGQAPAPGDTGKVVSGCPAGQTCPPPGGVPTDTGMVAGGCQPGQSCGPVFYRGSLDSVARAVQASHFLVLVQGPSGITKDSANPGSVRKDSLDGAILVCDFRVPMQVYAVLAADAAGQVLLLRDGMAVVVPRGGSEPNVQNPPPSTAGDTSKPAPPPLYTGGDTALVRSVLNQVSGAALVATAPGSVPSPVTLDATTVHAEGNATVIGEAGGARLFLVLAFQGAAGTQPDPSRPMVTERGNLVVVEKLITALK